jgi:monoamine oxidase
MNDLAIAERLWRVGENDFQFHSHHSYWESLVEVFGWDRLSIDFDTHVDAIQYESDANGVSVEAHITTAKEEFKRVSVFRSRYVIVTVPLSILKANRIRFTPPLPSPTTEAIHRLGMDAGIKIHIGFRERFWGEHVCEITLRTTSAFVWDAGFFKDRQRWSDNQPEVKKEKEKQRQAQVEKAGEGLYVLVCMITGRHAEEMSSTLISDDEKVTCLLSELDSLYEGAATRSLCQPTSLVHVQDWSKEPFIEGCYSYPTLGSYRSVTDNDRIDLSKAIANRLWIAGEAASLYHPATVLGAMEAGQRAAQEILTALL